MIRRTTGELLDDLAGPVEPDVGGRLVVVEGWGADSAADPRVAAALERLTTLPCVIVSEVPCDLADVVATRDEIADIEATFALAPLACTALALHLRASERRPPLDGLVAESAVFSTLQAGPEHGAWRSAHQRKQRPDAGQTVRVERTEQQLTITLDRPHVRNAVSAALRDELLAALAVAQSTTSLAVELRGNGPDFCAGGDLDEFGTTPDPATGHMVRTRRSIGAALHRLSPRTTAHLHGAAFGAGIELAAFAATVTATADTRIALPELGLGLIPGAGGTVSLPLRIGRHRTAWLALTRRTIDAATAHAWGLVDHVDHVGP